MFDLIYFVTQDSSKQLLVNTNYDDSIININNNVNNTNIDNHVINVNEMEHCENDDDDDEQNDKQMPDVSDDTTMMIATNAKLVCFRFRFFFIVFSVIFD